MILEALTKEETTKDIVVEFVVPKMAGEGKDRRRDMGAIFVDGTTNWMALSFVLVDAETGDVSFRVPTLNVTFAGVLEGDTISRTTEEGILSKGTFEIKANHDKTPVRHPEAESYGGTGGE